MAPDELKFHAIGLCGGKSLMLSPEAKYAVSMSEAANCLPAVIRSMSELIEFDYKGVRLTLYRTGSLMFYHMNVFETACCYAAEIYAMLGGAIRQE
jgi:hypothetical protein